MSDFFNDDFTAELKSYFLESLKGDVKKFIDLIDKTTWPRIQSELNEQTKIWSVDARSNEFEHLADWLQTFSDNTKSFDNHVDLVKSLQVLGDYLISLSQSKSDSQELRSKYSIAERQQKNHLFLHCFWGEHEFAISISQVVEISNKVPLTPLPDQKLKLHGVVPFRGEAIPVINWDYFEFGHQKGVSLFYVICEINNALVALQVSATNELVEIFEKDLSPIAENDFMIGHSVAKSFFIKNDQSIMVLDLEKLVA